jgi:hypothetical protein
MEVIHLALILREQWKCEVSLVKWPEYTTGDKKTRAFFFKRKQLNLKPKHFQCKNLKQYLLF